MDNNFLNRCISSFIENFCKMLIDSSITLESKIKFCNFALNLLSTKFSSSLKCDVYIENEITIPFASFMKTYLSKVKLNKSILLTRSQINGGRRKKNKTVKKQKGGFKFILFCIGILFIISELEKITRAPIDSSIDVKNSIKAELVRYIVLQENFPALLDDYVKPPYKILKKESESGDFEEWAHDALSEKNIIMKSELYLSGIIKLIRKDNPLIGHAVNFFITGDNEYFPEICILDSSKLFGENLYGPHIICSGESFISRSQSSSLNYFGIECQFMSSIDDIFSIYFSEYKYIIEDPTNTKNLIAGEDKSKVIGNIIDMVHKIGRIEKLNSLVKTDILFGLAAEKYKNSPSLPSLPSPSLPSPSLPSPSLPSLPSLPSPAREIALPYISKITHNLYDRMRLERIYSQNYNKFNTLYYRMRKINEKYTDSRALISQEDRNKIEKIIKDANSIDPDIQESLDILPNTMTPYYYKSWVEKNPDQRQQKLIQYLNSKGYTSVYDNFIKRYYQGNNIAYKKYERQTSVFDNYREMKYKSDSTLLFPNLNTNVAIPSNLFLFWHTSDLPPGLEDNIKTLKNNFNTDNDGRDDVHLFDIETGRQEIEKAIETISDEKEKDLMKCVLIVYNALQTNAYKCDIFRYFILYMNGGMYIDSKLINLPGTDIREPIGQHKEIFVQDMGKIGETGTQRQVYNAYIVSNKHSPSMLAAIKQTICNIITGFLGPNPLAPTGPLMLGSIFKSSAFTVSNVTKYFPLIQVPNGIADRKGAQIFTTYANYVKEKSRKGFPDQNNYNEAYKRDTYVYVPMLEPLIEIMEKWKGRRVNILDC